MCTPKIVDPNKDRLLRNVIKGIEDQATDKTASAIKANNNLEFRIVAKTGCLYKYHKNNVIINMAENTDTIKGLDIDEFTVFLS
jgi:hypothetical protein